MRLKISHTTHYRFQQPVQFGLQQLRKTPKSRHQQQVHGWTTVISGAVQQLSYEDQHRNRVELISLDRNATEVIITSRGEVDVEETNGIVGKHHEASPLWLYRRQTPRTKAGPGIRRLVRQVEGEGQVDQLHHLLALTSEAVTYEVGASSSDWTAEDAVTEGRGVCQDHAHVFLACAREMGLPARYVSGYLMMNDRVAQEAMHAWAEVHVDGLGWVGFDAANGISSDSRYVRVATGLDYSEAAPVTGTRIGGSGESLSVQIEVAQQ